MWKSEIVDTLWNLAAWLGAFLAGLTVALALLVLLLRFGAALRRVAARHPAARPAASIYSFYRTMVLEHGHCPMDRDCLLFSEDRR